MFVGRVAVSVAASRGGGSKEKPHAVKRRAKKTGHNGRTKIANVTEPSKPPVTVSFAYSKRAKGKRVGVKPTMKPLAWYVNYMTTDNELKAVTAKARALYKTYTLSKSEKDKKAYKVYKEKNFCALRSGVSGINKFQGFVTIDAEQLEPHQIEMLEYDKASVVMSGTSVNGIDKFYIIRTREPKDAGDFTEIAEALIKRYGIKSTEGQTSPDRLRFLPFHKPSELYVNPNAQPLSFNARGLTEIKPALNNMLALSVYSTLRYSYTAETAVKKILEYPIDKNSKTVTAETLPGLCAKWEAQYKETNDWANEDEADPLDLLELITPLINLSHNEIFLKLLREYPKQKKEFPLTNIIQIQQALREEGDKKDYLPLIQPDKPEKEQVILAMYDPVINEKERVLCTLGNYSLISGQKKSRKTLLTALFINLLPKGTRVVIFDTEQGAWRVHRRNEMLKGYCPHVTVTVYNLRGFATVQRRKIIDEMTEKEKPAFIIIDGIRDLISDINNPAEANDLIYWLEKLTGKEGTPHVMTILHANKADQNARGHIGTELENKAENVFHTAPINETSTRVINAFARDEQVSAFVIGHDSNGRPELLAFDKEKNAQNRNWNAFVNAFDVNPGATYTQLVTFLQTALKLKGSACKKIIAQAVTSEMLNKEGKTYTLGKAPEGGSENSALEKLELEDLRVDYDNVGVYD